MSKILLLLQSDSLLRIFIIIGICLILINVILFILDTAYYAGQKSISQITFLIGSTKDTFQTIFFLVIIAVTILSYLQARKTLFTPIKTEIFKMQIKAFEDILAFFQSKSETDFTEQFDYENILQSNSVLMFNNFVRNFYKDAIIDEKGRQELDVKLQELHKEFAGAVVTKSWAGKNIVKLDYYDKIDFEMPEEVTDPAMIMEKWKKYEYGPVHYSIKYFEEREKLNRIIASSLIPTELKNKLEEFDQLVRNNLILIGKVVNEIAQELPEKFPTRASFKNLEPLGIWNRYNKEKKEFEPTAREILKYIRLYLKIDKLVE